MIAVIHMRFFGLSLVIVGLCGFRAPVAHADDRLPAFLAGPVKTIKTEPRPWTIADIVEVRRVTDTAISDLTREVAFIVKQSFVDSDDIRYGLYVLERGGKSARKVMESAFIDQLAWHPNSALWTVRADFGRGIQLYDVDSAGLSRPLVVNDKTVLVGGAGSVVEPESDEAPRLTGVSSYEWAPDGNSLWYSVYRLRDAAARASMAERGIVFDDREMDLHSFAHDATTVLGVELHLLKPTEKSDRLLTFVPRGARSGILFRRPDGTAYWQKDSSHIRYTLWLSKPDASVDLSSWSVDVASGHANKLAGGTFSDIFFAVPAPDNRGYLTVRFMADGRHLIQVEDNGDVIKDFGKIGFKGIGMGYDMNAWSDQHGRQILAVNYEDRQGLAMFPQSRAGQSLEKLTDTLNHCSFTKDLAYGACVRESSTIPPELVDVRMTDGTLVTSVSVNPRYAQVRKLLVTPGEWQNRYGNRATGYITRSVPYRDSKRLPTILVTHGHDATNSFAPEVYQWEVPIQVLAEEGFLVLSVNEPASTAQSREASETKAGTRSKQSTSDMQFHDAFNVVAGMEAAIQSAIDSGVTDPDRTGIAGYSRGSEIVEWAMSQSTLFHVGIEGDAGGSLAGRYVLASPQARVRYQQLYGGSPFDPLAVPTYQTLSASFRSKQFAGPLLQLFAQGNGLAGLEIHALLQDAGIPSEFVYFPDENHIFWGPRHRAAAMQRSIDWLEYWLLGRRNEAGISQGDYRRWDAMAAAWRRSRH